MAQLIIPNGENNQEVVVGGSRDHSKLRKLDFASSGHTGFQEALTFDDEPTASSANPVKSGGVYSANKSIKDDINNIYTAPVSFSATYNSTTVYYYDFIPGATYSIMPTKTCGRIEIRNGETTYSSLNWVTVAANTTKAFTAPASATNVKVSYPGSGCSVIIKRTGTVVSGIESEIATVNAAVSTNKAAFDAIYIGGTFTVPKDTATYAPMTITSGKTYEVYATALLAVVRVYNGSTLVQQVTTQLPCGTRVKFTASGNGDSVYLYTSANGGATATITDLSTPVARTDSLAVSAQITNPFSGKTMAVCGDSICKGSFATTPWHALVQDRYGLASVQNLAQDGARYGIQGSYDRITVQVQSITGTPDIVAVFAGTNDFALNSVLGTRGDAASSSNGATFYAAVKYSMEYLLTNFPNAKIIYLTPLQRNDSGTYDAANRQGLRLSDYVDAIRELAGVYGVILCDVYRNSEFHVFNSTFKADYTGNSGDGLHPNEAGTALYTENAIFPVFDRVLLGWEDSVKALMR